MRDGNHRRIVTWRWGSRPCSGSEKQLKDPAGDGLGWSCCSRSDHAIVQGEVLVEALQIGQEMLHERLLFTGKSAG